MNKKKIADRLRNLRGSRPREEVALACGVTANAISMYETANRVPNDEIKLKLARFFNVSVQELFYAD